MNSWLNRTDRNFAENLEFGIKIILSPEFPTVAKYQSILEYFCRQLPKYRKHLLKSDIDFDSNWDVVNQFLGILFPQNAVSTDVQEDVLDLICDQATKTIETPKEGICHSFIVILKHNCYKKIFKFDLEKYGTFMGTFIDYLGKYIERTGKIPENIIKTTIEDVSHYVRGAAINTGFRQIFFDKMLLPFTMLVEILEQKTSSSCREELLKFLQQLCFMEENLDKYTRLFNGEEAEEGLIIVFDPKNRSKRIWLMITEAFLKSYKTVNANFVEFLFEQVCNPACEVFPVSDCLKFIEQMFKLFKKYDIILKKPEVVDEFDLISYLREKLEEICSEHYETSTKEILELVVTCVAYNPIIMERRLFSVLANCMFVSKSSLEVNQKYEEFVKAIIRMTYDLRRGEFFVVYLTKAVREKLESYKISKKLKRKANVNDSNGMRKKLKDANGSFSQSDMNSTLDESSTLDVKETPEILSKFKDIQYAWPYDATEQEFSHLISLLTSKQALTTWRLLSEFLNDELDSFTETTENKLFLIDLLSTLLCQFIANNQLTDHAHLYWDLINERCTYLRSVLTKFGKAILHMEHNRRLINAFLSICYEFSNFETLIWYYSPDSIVTEKDLVKEYPELPVLDLKQQSHTLHDYLTVEEWKLIEQRIKNFGKFECRSNINLVNLQKVHAALLFDDRKMLKKDWNHLVEMVLEDEEQIKMLIKDNSVNQWFVQHLNRSQMIKVANIIVNSSEDERSNLVSKAFMEVPEKIDLLCLVAISKMCSIANSILKNIDLEQILEKNVEYVGSNVASILMDAPAKNTIESEELKKCLELIKQLPIGFISIECRSIIFSLLLGTVINIGSDVDLAVILNEVMTSKIFLH